MLYKNEILFDILKQSIKLFAKKCPFIYRVTFYPGRKDRRYVLLFETDNQTKTDTPFFSNSNPLESIVSDSNPLAFFGEGFLNHQEGRDILQIAKSPKYQLEKKFFDNWYVFHREKDSEEFFLSDPLFKQEYVGDFLPIEEYKKLSRADKEGILFKKKDRFKDTLGPGLPKCPPILFLDYCNDSKDFIDDKSYALTKKGFEKFIISEKSLVLYNSCQLAIPNNENLSIPVPEGTTWDQIKIRYVNDDHVEMAHPGVDTHTPYSMADLGFSKKRELRSIFDLFAQNCGDINPKDMKPFKANISNLRKHLKGLFPGIEGKPIKKYSPKDGYCCEFKITKS